MISKTLWEPLGILFWAQGRHHRSIMMLTHWPLQGKVPGSPCYSVWVGTSDKPDLSSNFKHLPCVPLPGATLMYCSDVPGILERCWLSKVHHKSCSSPNSEKFATFLKLEESKMTRGRVTWGTVNGNLCPPQSIFSLEKLSSILDPRRFPFVGEEDFKDLKSHSVL